MPRSIEVRSTENRVRFQNCFFHPFFPIFRRSIDVHLSDIGKAFTVRSGSRNQAERRLLPTKFGYIYFRLDRTEDDQALKAIQKAQQNFLSSLSESNAAFLLKKNSRLPLVTKIALALVLITASCGLWYYFKVILPGL